MGGGWEQNRLAKVTQGAQGRAHLSVLRLILASLFFIFESQRLFLYKVDQNATLVGGERMNVKHRAWHIVGA